MPTGTHRDPITVPVFSTLCSEAFRLRREVFIIEQNVPPNEEFDADDLTCADVVAILNGDVCGTLRVIASEHDMKIGRVVTGMPWRGKGIAGAMLRQR